MSEYKVTDRILVKIWGTEYKAVVRDVLPKGVMSIYVDDAQFRSSDYEQRFIILSVNSPDIRKEMVDA